MQRKTKSANEADAVIATNIRAARLARHMSQEALGEKLGVTFQQIQKYEKGVNRVSAGRLISIAGALNVPVSDLLQGVDAGGGRSRPAVFDALALRKDGVKLAECFVRLSEAHQRAVVGLVVSLAA